MALNAQMYLNVNVFVFHLLVVSRMATPLNRNDKNNTFASWFSLVEDWSLTVSSLLLIVSTTNASVPAFLTFSSAAVVRTSVCGQELLS